jgi:hypothetical protein
MAIQEALSIMLPAFIHLTLFRLKGHFFRRFSVGSGGSSPTDTRDFKSARFFPIKADISKSILPFFDEKKVEKIKRVFLVFYQVFGEGTFLAGQSAPIEVYTRTFKLDRRDI